MIKTMINLQFDYHDGTAFEYEIEDYRIREALEEILADYLKIEKSKASIFCNFMIDELDLMSALIDFFEDDLIVVFEEEALDYYKECETFAQAPLGYFGMSERDFI